MPSKPYRPPVLERPRLIARIETAASKPILLIQAGAGYGKTTAVQQFLAYKGASHITLTLKEIHNLIEVLWQEFLEQLENLNSSFSSQYKKIQIPSDSANYAIFVEELRRIMRAIGSFYFVLDDYHTIAGSPTCRFIMKVIREQVPGLHVILITRSANHIDLADQAQAGRMETITEADLAFTREEQSTFLAARAGTMDTEALYKRTEGWPFAVRLLYHTLAPDKPLSYGMEDILPFVNLQMETEFFQNYTPEVQAALVRLSLPDTSRAPMLKQLAGCASPAVKTILEENPFITRSADGTIHLHRLYGDFLRSQKSLLTPADIKATNRACAEWLRANGHPFEAMNSYRACGDYPAVWVMVGHLLAGRTYPMPSQSMATHCLNILAETPAAVIREDPLILLYGALLQVCANDTAGAKNLLDTFFRLHSESPVPAALLGEAHLLYGIAFFIEWDASFATHWASAYGLMASPSKLIDRRFLLMHLAPLFSPRSLHNEDVTPLLIALQVSLPQFSALTGGCGTAFYETVRGILYYYEGRYSAALRLFHTGIAAAKQRGQYDALLNLLYYSIHSHIALGSYDAALQDLACLKSYSAHDPGADTLMPFADYSLAYFDSLLAPKPFTKPTQTPGTKSFPSKAGGRNVSSVMLTLLAAGEYREALEYMQQAAKLLRETHNHFPLCYSGVQGSYAALRLGLGSYSALLLEEAWQIANDGQYTTPFVQGGTRTLAVIAAYRTAPNRRIPDGWLHDVEALTKGWLESLSIMAKLYTASEAP